MTRNQNILLLFSILLLIALFNYIVFSRHGYSDLVLLRQEQGQLIQKNERLSRENLAIRSEIDRLKHDLDYIENWSLTMDIRILLPRRGHSFHYFIDALAVSCNLLVSTNKWRKV